MNTISPHNSSRNSSTLTTAQRTREEKRVYMHLARAIAAAMPATLTLKEWLAILDYYKWTCAYCKVAPYHSLEHYLPISKGGGTTAENCVPACNACNVTLDKKLPLGFSRFVREDQEIRDPRFIWYSAMELLQHLKTINVCEDMNASVIGYMLVCHKLLKVGEYYRLV